MCDIIINEKLHNLSGSGQKMLFGIIEQLFQYGMENIIQEYAIYLIQMSQVWVGGEFEEARHSNFRIGNNQHIQKIIVLILL